MAKIPKNSRINCYFECEKAAGGPLHHFPKVISDTERFNVWKEVLDDAVKDKGDTYIYNQLRLCNKHFESYYKSPSRRLTRNAIPTLHLRHEMHHVLHGFPNPETDQVRFNNWLHRIGGAVLSLPNEYIYKYRRVCRAHFEIKYLCRNNRLSNIAVPNLNIPASRCILHVAALTEGA